MRRSGQDQPLRHDLLRRLKEKGLFAPAVAAMVVARANEVGKGRFVAVRFRDGELLCLAGTLPPPELQLLAPELVAAINKKLGQPLVRTIRFKQ